MFFVNVIGIALIVWIIWWFWLYRPKSMAVVDNTLQVIVDNGVYQPAQLQVPAQQSVTINFLRKDPSPCAEMVVFPDLQITKTLPLNQAVRISLPAMDQGDYPFHCQMQMYRGQLHVV